MTQNVKTQPFDRQAMTARVVGQTMTDLYLQQQGYISLGRVQELLEQVAEQAFDLAVCEFEQLIAALAKHPNDPGHPGKYRLKIE